MAVPILPAMYVLAVALVHLDVLDKLIVFMLTVLSVGLLFPSSRQWAERILERLPGIRGADREAPRREPKPR